MADHQHNQNANELWLYFQNVINWIKVTFPNYRKEMNGVDWGTLYNNYKSNSYNSDKLEQEVSKLMMDRCGVNYHSINDISHEEIVVNLKSDN